MMLAPAREVRESIFEVQDYLLSKIVRSNIRSIQIVFPGYSPDDNSFLQFELHPTTLNLKYCIFTRTNQTNYVS